jgi:hypothetical protein
VVELVNPFGEHLGPGSGAAFVVLVAFLISFLAIRTSAPDAKRVVVRHPRVGPELIA